MEKLTSAERVAYAHGRIARDMQDFQRQIEHAHELIVRERNLWLALVILSTITLVIVFYLAGPNQLIDYVLIAIVFVTFTAIRFVSYDIIRRQITMMEWMGILYSRLADDETLGFGTETMKAEENGVVADRKLHEDLVAALGVLSALVTELEEKGRADVADSVAEEANSG